MRRSMNRSWLLGALGLMLCLTAASAEPAGAQCPDGQAGLNTLFDAYLQEAAKKASSDPGTEKAVIAAAERGVAVTPLAAPPTVQRGAPAGTGAATSLVNGAAFSELLSLAIDNDVLSGEENALTLNVSPFVIAALRDPGNYWDQERYRSRGNARLRKLGATISTGGKGDSFDRDGDGEKDEALEAQGLDDIVTWEVRWRLFGSRDRRDPANFDVFSRKVRASAEGDLLRRFLNVKGPLLLKIRAVLDPDGDGCATKALLERAIGSNTDAKALLESVAISFKGMADAYEEAASEVDQRMIWTLVVGGTERKTEFGPDKQMAAIRGAWKANTVNLEWSRAEAPDAGEPETLKLGWERSWQLRLKGFFGGDGAKASAGAAYEIYDNVPDAKHDTIAKANLKIELPIADGITLPVAVTWANHQDLLSDDDEIVGHFGINVETSKLWEKLKKKEGEAAAE